MTVPLLGPLSFSGFTHPWWWFAVAVVIAILGWYVVIQRSRHRRVLRFANMELLDRVAPPARRERLRHLPAVLLTVALVMVCVALAGPAYALRIPRNRAVVMLVIDVSESMIATDVTPDRLAAAKQAGKQFADELTPGINLGLVAFSGTASVLVSPTINRAMMKAAIDQLQPGERTATGEGIYTALQAIATLGAVMGSGDEAPPARIVLESDGKETIPTNPDDPRGAYPAARAAKQQGVAISTISFGTPDGEVTINGQRAPVPVDDETLRKISDLSGGQTFHAASLSELDRVYADLQQQIGFETVPADASGSWLRLGAIMLAAAVATGLLINRRLPG